MKKLNDIDVFMIGCDGCENWFHGTCVGVTPKEAEKLKAYHCPECRKKNRRKETRDEDESKSKPDSKPGTVNKPQKKPAPNANKNDSTPHHHTNGVLKHESHAGNNTSKNQMNGSTKPKNGTTSHSSIHNNTNTNGTVKRETIKDAIKRETSNPKSSVNSSKPPLRSPVNTNNHNPNNNNNNNSRKPNDNNKQSNNNNASMNVKKEDEKMNSNENGRKPKRKRVIDDEDEDEQTATNDSVSNNATPSVSTTTLSSFDSHRPPPSPYNSNTSSLNNSASGMNESNGIELNNSGGALGTNVSSVSNRGENGGIIVNVNGSNNGVPRRARTKEVRPASSLPPNKRHKSISYLSSSNCTPTSSPSVTPNASPCPYPPSVNNHDSSSSHPSIVPIPLNSNTNTNPPSTLNGVVGNSTNSNNSNNGINGNTGANVEARTSHSANLSSNSSGTPSSNSFTITNHTSSSNHNHTSTGTHSTPNIHNNSISIHQHTGHSPTPNRQSNASHLAKANVSPQPSTVSTTVQVSPTTTVTVLAHNANGINFKKCVNTECTKSATSHSKYCSNECGIEVARRRMATNPISPIHSTPVNNNSVTHHNTGNSNNTQTNSKPKTDTTSPTIRKPSAVNNSNNNNNNSVPMVTVVQHSNRDSSIRSPTNSTQGGEGGYPSLPELKPGESRVTLLQKHQALYPNYPFSSADLLDLSQLSSLSTLQTSLLTQLDSLSSSLSSLSASIAHASTLFISDQELIAKMSEFPSPSSNSSSGDIIDCSSCGQPIPMKSIASHLYHCLLKKKKMVNSGSNNNGNDDVNLAMSNIRGDSGSGERMCGCPTTDFDNGWCERLRRLCKKHVNWENISRGEMEQEKKRVKEQLRDVERDLGVVKMRIERRGKVLLDNEHFVIVEDNK
eukprot:TRINITY_DN1795_c0_g1_i2.p1 TRINITY_DN1795_c0_g1~~TRINITY_DN1795_c0_g1_i2.p1  ORF type:complete len:897 (-),score=242.86 TRINITY_DN1795_c0_g1_i2:5-2695(-)